MRTTAALAGLLVASPVSGEQVEVRPAVELRECRAGVDYQVKVKFPMGRHLSVQMRRARSQATQTLTRYLFGMETGKEVAVESRDGDIVATKIKHSARTNGLLRSMVYRGINEVASKLEFAFTLSYSNDLSTVVYDLVCEEK